MSDDEAAKSVDRDRARRENPFDSDDGYSGQDYHRDREAELARQDPSGGKPGDMPNEAGDNVPPEAGRRPHIDPATGAVHGSGAGAGGGNPGEDYDSDAQGGSGYARTGAEGDEGT